MENRDAWSKVVSRNADGTVNYEATKEQLKKFIALQSHDQEAMKEAILEVLRANALHSHMTKPTLLFSACSRVTQDFAIWPELQERGAEVIKRDLTVAKGKGGGIVNPFYTAPAAETK